MAKLPIPLQYGFTIFCDDIRYEVDGKITYIGAYTGEMIVGSPFPVQLPKFGIAVTLAVASVEEKDFAFQIYLPGDIEGSPTISLEPQGNSTELEVPPEFASLDDPRFAIRFNGVFSPMVISKGGFIEVRAVKGENYMRVGRLRVVSASEMS